MKQYRAMKTVLTLTAVAGLALGQAPKKAPPSPAMETSVTVGGKNVSIKYSAPSVKGRKIFGGSDAPQPDNKIWRAGANNATAPHTDAALKVGSVDVAAGDYTLYVSLEPTWQLVISKQTGQWGINRDGSTTLDKAQEVGRVPMKMSKPDSLVEQYKMTLAATGGNKGTLTLEWENKKASVDFTAK